MECAHEYHDIKGHLKYDLLKTVILSVSGATMIGLLYAFWQRLKQVPLDMYLLGGLFILSTFVFFYSANRRQPIRSQQTQKPEPELPPPTIDPKKPNLKCEIQEILFDVQRQLINNEIRVLMQVQVVNYGDQEVVVTEWSLIVEAGKGELSGEEESIPDNWRIRRRITGRGERIETIDKKFSDSSEPFRKGIPQRGWINFKLHTLSRPYPPYAAKFILKVKDALGEEHVTVLDPGFYEETGEIFVDS
jgi:hypothetical protein